MDPGFAIATPAAREPEMFIRQVWDDFFEAKKSGVAVVPLLYLGEQRPSLSKMCGYLWPVPTQSKS